MKNVVALVVVLLVAVNGLYAKDRVSPHATIKGEHLKITYGRPNKKGRDVFGGLVPFNTVWRTGADEATEITIDKDGTFGNKPIKAGTYTLFTIPGKEEWTIILNSQLGQWGAFEYDKNKSKDVLQVKLKPHHLESVVEQFTITIEKSDLKLEWDQTSITIPTQF